MTDSDSYNHADMAVKDTQRTFEAVGKLPSSEITENIKLHLSEIEKQLENKQYETALRNAKILDDYIPAPEPNENLDWGFVRSSTIEIVWELEDHLDIKY